MDPTLTIIAIVVGAYVILQATHSVSNAVSSAGNSAGAGAAQAGANIGGGIQSAGSSIGQGLAAIGAGIGSSSTTRNGALMPGVGMAGGGSPNDNIGTQGQNNYMSPAAGASDGSGGSVGGDNSAYTDPNSVDATGATTNWAVAGGFDSSQLTLDTGTNDGEANAG